MVNIERYKTFLAVCKTKSFCLAAKELCVTQAAISKSIKALESELNGVLFVRSNKGLELTPEGYALYNKVNLAIDILMSAESEFGKYTKLETGEVRIGISTVLTKIILLDVIKKFRIDYPNIIINITNGMTSDLLKMVSKNQLDFVIYNGTFIPPDVKSQLLTEIDYVFAYNKKFFQCENIKDIVKYPLIAQKDGTFTREFMDWYLDSLGFENKIVPSIEVVSQELVREMVERGIGIGFLYKPLVRNVNILGEPIQNKVYITSGKNGMTAAATEFKKYIERSINHEEV